MTTYTIDAWAIVRNGNDDPIDFYEAPIDFVVEDGSTSFNYTVVDDPGDYLAIDVDIPGLQAVSFDGLNDPLLGAEYQAELTQVSWGGGNQTIMMAFELFDGSGSTSYIFPISGDAIPETTDLAGFASLESSVTGVSSAMPPGFQAGDAINFTSFPNISVSEDDVFIGTGADDSFLGGAGNDTLLGDNGDDALDGGEGKDKIIGGGGSDILHGGGGKDKIKAGAGGDIAHGGDGKDNVKGQGGADDLYGNAGNDKLNGGGKNDILDGGIGDDVLVGGKGADVFVYASGADVIKDFGKGNDKLEILNNLINLTGSFEAYLDAVASQVGDDVVLDYGDGDTLTLQDVSLSSLEEGMFI